MLSELFILVFWQSASDSEKKTPVRVRGVRVSGTRPSYLCASPFPSQFHLRAARFPPLIKPNNPNSDQDGKRSLLSDGDGTADNFSFFFFFFFFWGMQPRRSPSPTIHWLDCPSARSTGSVCFDGTTALSSSSKSAPPPPPPPPPPPQYTASRTHRGLVRLDSPLQNFSYPVTRA